MTARQAYIAYKLGKPVKFNLTGKVYRILAYTESIAEGRSLHDRIERKDCYRYSFKIKDPNGSAYIVSADLLIEIEPVSEENIYFQIPIMAE